MQLLTTTALLLLPLTTLATTTPNANSISNRGFTDSVKSLFGDPAAMINDLSDCMTACARVALAEVDCMLEGIDCLCKKNGGDDSAGKDWEDQTKACFSSQGAQAVYSSFDCKDKYEEGKLLDICKAYGEKPDKKNETDEAIVEKFALVEIVNAAFGIEGNGTSAAALGVVEAAGVARIAGVVLAAAVGYAVAML